MQKSGFLFLVLCFVLTGCLTARKSATWEKVRRVRVNTSEAADPSAAYAQELHRLLQSDRVPHKVVTYQYRYTTKLREEAIGTRTAVIYHDAARSASPWWLADESVSTPVWLPEGDLNRQVRFYARRPSEVVEVCDFPGGADGKTMVRENAIRSAGHQSRWSPETAPTTPVTERSNAAQGPLLSRIWSTMTKPFRMFGQRAHAR